MANPQPLQHLPEINVQGVETVGGNVHYHELTGVAIGAERGHGDVAYLGEVVLEGLVGERGPVDGPTAVRGAMLVEDVAADRSESVLETVESGVAVTGLYLFLRIY